MNNEIIFIAIGIVAGILSGMFGIGGGIVIIPALMYFCKLDQLTAQGTSLAILLPPIGILAVREYYKKGNVNINAAIIICICIVGGSFFGAKLAPMIPKEILKKGFGILLLISAWKYLK